MLVTSAQRYLWAPSEVFLFSVRCDAKHEHPPEAKIQAVQLNQVDADDFASSSPKQTRHTSNVNNLILNNS